MEYNEVLEHFKKDIQNNPDIEIIKLKHGVMIFYWDEAEHSYLSFLLSFTAMLRLYAIWSFFILLQRR